MPTIFKDIILDAEKYDGTYISIRNSSIAGFGFKAYKDSVQSDNPWYKSSETNQIDSDEVKLYDLIQHNNLYLFYQPDKADKNARSFVIDYKGENEHKSVSFSITGQFLLMEGRYGPGHIFNISEFSYGNRTFKGILPLFQGKP